MLRILDSINMILNKEDLSELQAENRVVANLAKKFSAKLCISATAGRSPGTCEVHKSQLKRQNAKFLC